MPDEAVVHVVDDDMATRDALHALFNSVSLRSRGYASAEEFLRSFDNNQPGCLILDLRMPGMSGLELQRALREKQCVLPVIFITGHGKINAAVRAMHGGAVDFLTKPVDDDILLETVRDAIRRNQAQSQTQRERARVQACVDSLTPREGEILDGVSRGLSNKEIARELDISHKTVELHRAHMMEKMQARSIAEVVQMHLIASTAAGGGTGSEEEE